MKIIVSSDNGMRHTQLNIDLGLFVLMPLIGVFLVVISYFHLKNLVQEYHYDQAQPAIGGLADVDDNLIHKKTSYHPDITYNSVHYAPSKVISSQFSKPAVLSKVPVKNARLSSAYGFRTDPFSGNKRLHRGVDIAAKAGSNIHALASGFVVYSGRKSSYGNVIEIQHDKSLITRYAHLKNTLVRRGSVVHEGDVIAKLGSTGRSTGPHLHLEVLKNGRNVNPELYFNGSLIGR